MSRKALKKIIKVSLIAVMAAVFAVSSAVEPMPAYASSKSDYKYDQPDYDSYSVKEYDDAGNKGTLYKSSDERKKTVVMMNKMANVEWKVKTSFSYRYATASTRKTKIRSGIKYYGLPYTQLNRSHPMTSSKKVKKMMIKASKGEGKVKGVDCSYAVAYSIRTGKNKTESSKYLSRNNGTLYYSASYFFDGMRSSEGSVDFAGRTVRFRDDLDKVGWYGKYKGFSKAMTTAEVINKLKGDRNYPDGAGDIFSNVYAKVRPGDVLVNLSSTEAHVIMVTGLKIKYKGDKIDPDKSRIIITDQNKPNKRFVEKKKWASSWRRNYSGPWASFRALMDLGYIPVTAFDRDKTYTVSYSSKGGIEVPSEHKKEVYDNVKLGKKALEWTGHTFKGWRAEEDPLHKLYQPGDYYDRDIDETMQAEWTTNKCTIIYDDGVEEAEEEPEDTADTEDSEGTEEDGSQDTEGPDEDPGEEPDDVSDEDIPEEEIEVPEEQTKNFGKSINLSSNIPERKGYTFMGWSLKEGGDPDYYPGNLYVDDSMIEDSEHETVILYAVWKEGEDESVDLSSENIIDAEDVDVVMSDESFTYDGKSHKPKISISYKGNKLKKENYKIEIEKNKKRIGEHFISVTFSNGMQGTKILSYMIKGDLTDPSTKVTVIRIGNKIYEGIPIRPEPLVYALDGDGSISNLKKGRDFDLRYENNDAVGLGRIWIDGTGNYEGTISVMFRIRPGEEADNKYNSRKLKTERKYS